ncbi:MAG: hypothetical protein ABW034_18215, partial [Steroidobacteraceae bacterium]
MRSGNSMEGLKLVSGVMLMWAFCVQPSLALPLERPTTRVQFYDFAVTGTNGEWDSTAGKWSVDGQAYGAASAAKAISTLNAYYDTPYAAPTISVQLDDYIFGVRMLNPSAASGSMVGLVYNYQDAKNYYEAVFTPTRVAQLRRITNGTATVLSSRTYSEGGQGNWFDVELVRQGNALSTLVVNGNVIASDVATSAVPRGRLGVVAYNTAGKFAKVTIERPVGDQPFKETFQDGVAQGWPRIDGNNWTIADGVLKNFTVLQTNKIYLPASTDSQYWDPVTAALRLKMRSPYGAAGNLVGLFWGDDGSGAYKELVFSRTGVARINAVHADGSITTLASAAIPKLSSDWFDVSVGVGFDTTVGLNGKAVFSNLPLEFPTGRIGLITHWSPGQFDAVEFQERPFPTPYSESFTAAAANVVALSGIWITAGDTLTSVGLGDSDLTTFVASPNPSRQYVPRGSVDFSYRAKLINQATTADGAVGMITHYNHEAREFYEVLFTAAGQLLVNKYVQGTIVQQALGTHGIAPNTWFDVELRCVDNKTSVFVNGVKKLSGILQG